MFRQLPTAKESVAALPRHVPAELRFQAHRSRPAAATPRTRISAWPESLRISYDNQGDGRPGERSFDRRMERSAAAQGRSSQPNPSTHRNEIFAARLELQDVGM